MTQYKRYAQVCVDATAPKGAWVIDCPLCSSCSDRSFLCRPGATCSLRGGVALNASAALDTTAASLRLETGIGADSLPGVPGSPRIPYGS